MSLARVIEPVSKLDTIRVLEEIGIVPPGYRTIVRRLPGYAREEWRQRLAQACAAHVRLGPATLVINDVTTLYFETDEGDGFCEPGFSKERRHGAPDHRRLVDRCAGVPPPRSAGRGVGLSRNNVSCSGAWCPSLDLGGSTDPTTQVRVCRRT